MSMSRTLRGALGAALLLVGVAGEAQADRNRYTRLRPGQYHPYYHRYHRYYGAPIVPYGFYGGGYGYRPRYGYGGGFGYGPRFGGYPRPY